MKNFGSLALFRSVAGCGLILGAHLAGAGLSAGAGAREAALSSPLPQRVEFHVRPGGIQPFTSTEPAVRPQLRRPGKPNWATGGIEPAFWLSGEGTSPEKAFGTIYQAQLAVREWVRTRGTPREGIRVVVHGGVYRLDAPLVFVPEDSGQAGKPVVYAAAPGERPVLSGGVAVIGWKKVQAPVDGLGAAAQEQVWVAPAPEEGSSYLEFRQLYVNGRKAIRARTPNEEQYRRLSQWDLPARQVLAPARNLARWRNLKSVEMVLQQSWAISYARLDSIEFEGEQARVTFQSPERNLLFSRPYPWPRTNALYHLVNAIEFLDAPGEWYLDRAAGRVYYWPRPGERMDSAEVVVPRLESLVRIKGSLDRPVHDLQFNGLSFEYSTWLLPSRQGLVAFQVGQYVEHPAYRIQGGTAQAPDLDNLTWSARPPAAVYLAGANDIRFERCCFRHTASTALDLHFGARADEVLGCRFEDIGGNGLQLGRFSEDGLEAHRPYNPRDTRELCLNDRVANNVFRGCGTEDWGCAALAAGYPRGLLIEHNDLSALPYCGITVGWGWTPLRTCMRDNKIRFNRVHNFMRRMGDSGGIYLLSNQKPSEICGNYIFDLRCASVGSDGGYMVYLDQGAAGVLVKDNLTDTNAFMSNLTGPGNRWVNTGTNGPAILKAPSGTPGAAGVEAGYLDLLQ
jgi:hypothetical protein